jgi:hypothetical protein
MDDYSVSYSADMTNNPVFWAVYAVLVLVAIIALWRVFTKAGRPGWAAIIPIYNIYTLVKIGGKSGWYVLGFLVPVLGFVLYILLALGVAKNFGKSSVFGIVGLWIFSFIGYLILGFGSAKYVGNEAAAA